MFPSAAGRRAAPGPQGVPRPTELIWGSTQNGTGKKSAGEPSGGNERSADAALAKLGRDGLCEGPGGRPPERQHAGAASEPSRAQGQGGKGLPPEPEAAAPAGLLASRSG